MIVAVSSMMVAGSSRIQGSLQGLQGSPVAGYWELLQGPLGSLRDRSLFSGVGGGGPLN